MDKFFEQVYRIVAKIPMGKVATYGQIAALIGNPRSARVVGWAVASTPRGLKIPCHRVVNRLGQMAPGLVFGGEDIQRAMLESEGVTFKENGFIDMRRHLWQSDEK
jgi:methylated-DNA-protein-cysteine methyltransferase-like protein